jgi:hypothetical protein
MSDNREGAGGEAAARLAKTYVEWQDPFPAATPAVKIIFHGLFCFFFRGKNQCFVGTHNTTREPGGAHAASHPHAYEVRILQKDNGLPTELRAYAAPGGDPAAVPRMNFITSGSAFPNAAAPGVYVYTGPGHAEFNRRTEDDRRDWRWIIDFEELVYPDGVKGRKAGTIMPGVRIDNGLFHTHTRTVSAFDLVPEGGGTPIPLNHVAEISAADIHLAERGSVRITGGPVGNRLLEYAPNRTFEVYVLNLCDEGSHPACDFDPDSPNKEERNDFFLQYETFERALNPPEYMLVKRPDGRIHDDTPCGAVGYGGTPEP